MANMNIVKQFRQLLNRINMGMVMKTTVQNDCL